MYMCSARFPKNLFTAVPPQPWQHGFIFLFCQNWNEAE